MKVPFVKTFKYYVLVCEGTIAIAFGLLAPVLIGAVGVATDVSQAYLVRQRLHGAIDAAALASSAASQDAEEVEERIREFLTANYPAEEIGELKENQIVITVTDREVHVRAAAVFYTSFMSILGYEQITVSSATTVKRINMINVELAIALDLSNSMNTDGKINDLIVAANDMVDIIIQKDQTEYKQRIALVPYGTAVNVGNLSSSLRGAVTNTVCDGRYNGSTPSYLLATSRPYPTCQRYRFYPHTGGGEKTFNITNCVTERVGVNAYTDIKPVSTNVNTLLGKHYPPVASDCLSSQIVPLTNDKAELHDNIDNLVAAGSTGGQVGVAWGWYMLSPNFNSFWPAESAAEPYGTEELAKIMVLMTDGEYNSPYCRGVISRDATSGSGSTANHINCNANNSSSYAQAEALCTQMKKAGVVVYTIGFQIVPGAAATNLMYNCASEPKATHARTADDGDELIEVFREVAGDIMTVYVAQ